MKQLLVLLSLISVFSSAFAQDQVFLDSLESLLSDLEGREKSIMLGELSYQYSMKDNAKAREFGREGVAVALETNDSVAIAQAWNDFSIPYLYKGDYDSCILLNEKALAYRVALGDSIGVAKSLSKMANATYELGNMSDALALNFRALDIFKNAEMHLYVGRILNNVGNIYDRNENYERALEVYEDAIETAELSGIKVDYITAAGNLANTYQKIGKLKEAEKIFLDLIPIIKKEVNDEYLAAVYQGLGVNMRKQKRPQEGLKYYEKALELYTKVGSEVSMSYVEVNLGYSHMENGDYEKAEEYYKRGLELAKRTKSHYNLKHAYLGLAHLENRKGNYEKSDGYFDLYQDYMAKVYNEESNALISEMQVKYDTEKLDKELAQERLVNAENELEIQRGNLRTAVIGGIALLVLLTGVFLFRAQRNKRQQELAAFELKTAVQQAESEQKIAREKLRISRELHDNIGARLTHIISSLDIAAYKNEEAEGLQTVNVFAKETMSQLRETIWAVGDKAIFFSEFASRVANHLEQTNKMVEMTIDFKNEVKQDFELNSTRTINFYRIIQESISNAVKYSGAKSIHVHFYEKDSRIFLSTSDNGSGFTADKEKQGSGIRGMRSRAEEAEARISIESEIGAGTTVEIEFASE